MSPASLVVVVGGCAAVFQHEDSSRHNRTAGGRACRQIVVFVSHACLALCISRATTSSLHCARAIMKPQAVEFLVHMSLATAAAAVNSLAEEVMVDDDTPRMRRTSHSSSDSRQPLSRSVSHFDNQHADPNHPSYKPSVSVSRERGPHRIVSVTGAQLNLQWDSLRNVEYLTDGGNNWIHTAVFHGKSVVVKTLKPECQDVAVAINEIEGELEVHSRLDHPHIVQLIGAGFTPRGVRFMVLERLDGGTLNQLLGYDNRIRDRRRRFWSKKKISYMEVLACARSLADAMAYCHGRAIPNVMLLHRDLKVRCSRSRLLVGDLLMGLIDYMFLSSKPDNVGECLCMPRGDIFC